MIADLIDSFTIYNTYILQMGRADYNIFATYVICRSGEPKISQKSPFWVEKGLFLWLTLGARIGSTDAGYRLRDGTESQQI